MTRVLIVDDDPDVLGILGARMRQVGYDVRTAADGVEALAVLSAALGRPDVVLTDVSMPRLDGWELLRRCRADSVLCALPVLMMSAASGLEELAMARGAAGFLAKPFAWQEAQQALELALHPDGAHG
jgi:CheY-like chemotaxis protein